MTDSQLVLHIGAPKCGSSALQAALTRQPVLTAADGRRFRYVSLGRGAGPPRLIEGQSLRRIADTSVFGYATFPAVPRDDSTQAYFEAIDATRRRGLRGGFVPILSSEAWIGDPALFAAALAAAGNPPVDAVAFLRAPVDWLNAAYWQWGVWSQPRFERWYGAGRNPYTLAEDLEGWAAIPNLRLHVFSGRADVVERFGRHLGVALEGSGTVNRSSPPVLIGFLLRNRQFRPDGHAPQTEFVFQRWCPAPPGRKPWAVRPADVHAVRPLARRTAEKLQQLLSADDCARLFADPRWQSERPYHPDILLKPTPLHRLDEPPMLWESLKHGISAAAMAAEADPPDLPDPPAPDSDHAAWDAVLSVAMETLLRLDEAARRRALRRSFVGSVKGWLATVTRPDPART